MVDASYRFELRELNELNFERFDAKLEQRIAELRAEMQVGFAKMESKFAGVDGKLAQMETRLPKRMFGFWIAQATTSASLPTTAGSCSSWGALGRPTSK